MQREIMVISKEPPPLSGEVRVTGRCYVLKGTLIIIADEIHPVGIDVDLDTHKRELLELCPYATNDIDVLEDFMLSKARDYAAHVTKIYGRPELHIITDLVYHSALRFRHGGLLRRGWLDANMIGKTRSGKSGTTYSLMRHFGLGEYASCMENVSRSGLTMGAISSGKSGRFRVRPGLFPRLHRKLLILDEFHHMVEKSGKSVMTHLQSARDRGVITGIKVYGNVDMPAAVRLITISNYVGGNRDTHRFLAQHIAKLYELPEVLARLDLAFGVDEEAPDDDLTGVEHVWHPALSQCLVQRSWAMDPDHVHIRDDASELAMREIERMAKIYAEEVPLFTKFDKFYCLLRIAIAVANASFSHPRGRPMECEVRAVHVQYAVRLLELCYHSIGYDEMSSVLIKKRELANPFEVEAQLTVKLGLHDARTAAVTLSSLSERQDRKVVLSHTGLDIAESERWVGRMLRLGALEIGRDGYQVFVQPTTGGAKLLKNLIYAAENYENVYEMRWRAVAQWFNQTNDRKEGPSGMFPMNLDLKYLIPELKDADRDGGGKVVPFGSH